MSLRQLFFLVPVAASLDCVQPLVELGQLHVLNSCILASPYKRTQLQRFAITPESFESSGTTVTKDELRAELERQEQRYKDVYGGEITTYAAQPDPERKPWRKKASVLDQAFKQELQKMEQDLKEEH